MIKKQEILNVLVEYGLSIVEYTRALDSVENFRLTIEDIIAKAIDDEKWITSQKE